MEQSLPSPPLSRTGTPAKGRMEQTIEERLDGLLADYLDLLDSYTKLRQELSSQFSEGFFALAKAQRSANMGSGRRYGRDGYDSRMKASRRVKIGEADCFAQEASSQIERPERHSMTVATHSAAEEHLPDQVESGSPDEEPTEKGQEGRPSDVCYRNPATWYGLLVPKPLRDTQQYFIQALEGPIPKLLDIRSSLENSEQQIWDCRNSLGIENQYTRMPETEKSESDSVTEIDRLLTQAKLDPRS